MIGEPHTESDLSALRDEGKPQAGLRYLVSEEPEDDDFLLAPAAIHTAADGTPIMTLPENRHE